MSSSIDFDQLLSVCREEMALLCRTRDETNEKINDLFDRICDLEEGKTAALRRELEKISAP